MSLRQQQRGVALLAAILLVAIGTILAAAIAFASAMAARRGTASLSFEQSALVAEGAEALAAYALQDDDLKVDHMFESWARPLPPTEITPGVVLEASMEDLSGRFNLNSLVDQDGKVDIEALESLQRLLEMLELEPKWAAEIADWIDPDGNPTGSEGLEDGGTTSQDPPYRTANTFITSTSELLALPKFGRERYRKLAPYVTALPPGTKLNVCTASGLVLDAMFDEGYRYYSQEPEKLAKDREKGCSPLLQAYKDVLQTDKHPTNSKWLAPILERFTDKSDYFRLTSLVSLGGSEFALYSLLKREKVGGQIKVRVIQRSFTAN
jgi:Type II secretory pathway, component PulK